METSSKKITIGLDIGMASIGWAVIDNSNSKILATGSHIFKAAEQPKTGASLALPRRAKRSQRRTIRRKAFRMKKLWLFFQHNNLVQKNEDKESYFLLSNQDCDIWQIRIDALSRLLKPKEITRILYYYAKHRGYKSNRKEEKSTDTETGKILKSLTANKEKLKEYQTFGAMVFNQTKDQTFPIRRNQTDNYQWMIDRPTLLEEIGTIFEKQRQLGNNVLNEEFENKYLEILNKQNHYAEGHDIKSKIGKCTFEPQELRASKNSFSSEKFRLLNFINNNIRLTQLGKRAIPLDSQQKTTLYNLFLSNPDITYTRIRKELNISDEYQFANLKYLPSYKDISGLFWKKLVSKEELKNKDKQNEYHQKINELTQKALNILVNSEATQIKTELSQLSFDSKIVENIITLSKPEKEKVFKTKSTNLLLGYSQIKKAVENNNKDAWQELIENEKNLDIIAETVTHYKVETTIQKELEDRLPSYLEYKQQIIDCCLELDFSQTINLSFKALYKILPYIEQGMDYDKACIEAGYHHSQFDYDKHTLLPQIDTEDLTNPVMIRAVTQTRKLINAIIKKYGSPHTVHIELQRDLSKSREERNKIENQMKENWASNQRLVEELKNSHNLSNPKPFDIVKLKFWHEQNGYCAYSQAYIEPNRLFENGYVQVDHILPYSRSFDNGNFNKVLCLSSANQNKLNRTPFEWFNQTNQNWEEFKVKINSTHLASQKKQKLLNESFQQEEDTEEYKERALTDTRYISKFIKNFIENHLEFYSDDQDKENRRKVTVVNGSITAYLRRNWGLERLKYSYETGDKKRESDKNHAVDALVVACASSSFIQKISTYNRVLEQKKYTKNSDKNYVNTQTGEIIIFPEPWHNFSKEVVNFYDCINQEQLLEKLGLKYQGMNIQPMCVSRMPTRKVKGEVHKETVNSAKLFETEQIQDYNTLMLEKFKEKRHLDFNKNYIIKKVALSDLTLKILENMMGNDFKLKELLKSRLEQFGNDGKKAFAKPVSKPSENPDNAPVVKSVKVYEVASGIKINKGITANGDMIRVDLFYSNQKWLIVPIYTKDRVNSELPNKAITAKKIEDEWDTVENENFIFSLYPNDLLKVVTKDNEVFYGYYNSTNRSNGKMILETIDRSHWKNYIVKLKLQKYQPTFLTEHPYQLGLSIKLSKFKLIKCEIDVLGNIQEIANIDRKHQREKLRKPKQKG